MAFKFSLGCVLILSCVVNSVHAGAVFEEGKCRLGNAEACFNLAYDYDMAEALGSHFLFLHNLTSNLYSKPAS